jgi:peroxiredoxin
MDLRGRLAALKADFESGGPPYHAPKWVFETIHRGNAELIASRADDFAKKAGELAPDFMLKDAEGNVVSSRELLAQGPLIVTFYRGVWCPYCNLDLQALQEALPTFRLAGAKLVAISPQTAANSRRSMRENALEFPILSDPGNAVAASFGLRFTLPDYLVDLYKNTFRNDLSIVNGDASWTLPIPGRFLIGQDHRIEYAEVDPDYTNRPDPSELLPALRGLSGAHA